VAMTIREQFDRWPYGPQFYPRELASFLNIRPLIAEQLCRKLRLSRIGCAVGRLYKTEDLLVALTHRPHLIAWSMVQNEVHNIGETQLTLELGSSFPPYYTADRKD
jgi:hypothetical protein